MSGRGDELLLLRASSGVVDRDGVRVPELWWPTVTVRPTVKESLTVEADVKDSLTGDPVDAEEGDCVEGDD